MEECSSFVSRLPPGAGQPGAGLNMGQATVDTTQDLFGALGVGRDATDVEVRRAFKTLITKEHPDKGGSPERFKLIKLAYDTLSNTAKREHYEKTGRIARSAGEEFMDKFRGGSFGEFQASRQKQKEELAEALTVSKRQEQSHSAGFEAWMRSRGQNGTVVFTADSMAEQFGVNQGTYDAVRLPPLVYQQAVVEAAGPVREVARLRTARLPAELAWGEVLVAVKYAPVDAADVYSSALGGLYGAAAVDPPFVAGHHGVGVVAKVGPGVKALREEDWVVPLRSHLGTWRALAVVKAADLLAVPRACMPLEYACLQQQLCLAYRLLEDFGTLKPGDCVALNAAGSTVGQAVIQLCATLQLRTVAVVAPSDGFSRAADRLKALGATEVLPDAGSLKAELDKLKFFAKPRLALDAVGGASALRLADCLAEGGQVVVYGCLSGKAPVWPWQAWVFRGLQVQGFNLQAWMAKNAAKVPAMMATLGQLVEAEQLRLAVTEYELAGELAEALEHATDRGTHTKALLRMPEPVPAPEADEEAMDE